MYNAEDILDAREKRVEKQVKILKKYSNTLIVVRANYPGINKDNALTREIVNIIKKELVQRFNIENLCTCKSEKSYKTELMGKNNSILFMELQFTPEGPILFMVVNEEFKNVKKMCISVEEEHFLGRFVDIDVYNEKGKGISRRDLGLGNRKCFICNEDAHICVRCKKHSEEEIINFIKNRFKEYGEKAYE